MLRIGMQAPEFEVRLHSGLRFRLTDHIGNANVVLFFFPRAGAWQGKREIESFSHHLRELRGLDAVVLGVSDGPPPDLASLEHRIGGTIHFGIDPQLEVCRNYRVLWLGSKGIRRVTYVIDKSGMIRGVAHHELLLERHWTHVERVLVSLRDEAAMASYNRKATDL